MPRQNPLLIEKIKQEIQANTSINQISKKYSIAKSKVYYYYKQIKGKRYVAPAINPGYSELEGEIVGIFAGDGSQYYHKKNGHYEVNVHFGNHNKKYALYVQELFEKYFKKKFRLNTSGPTMRLCIDSKKIYNYFSYYLQYIPQLKHCTVNLKTSDVPMEFKKGFIKGFVDTDGSILYDKHDKTVRISLHSTSESLMRQLGAIFVELEIGHTIRCQSDKRGYKSVFIIRIRTSSVRKFLEIIYPYKTKHVQTFFMDRYGSYINISIAP